MPELTVVLPIYNEAEIIEFVIKDWVYVLRDLKISFQINAYNDGSTDTTLNILEKMTKEISEINVIDKSNSGHGPTILQGYREANTPWIFQVDSDNEMKAEHFYKLWERRKNYDFLIGIRENRIQSLVRKIISAVSRLTVKLFFGYGVTDVNCPYRLMRREKFTNIFQSIPNNTFAPNVIIAGIAAKFRMRIFETPVPIIFRTTGKVSIKKWKLFRAAIISWWQTIRCRHLVTTNYTN